MVSLDRVFSPRFTLFVVKTLIHPLLRKLSRLPSSVLKDAVPEPFAKLKDTAVVDTWTSCARP